MSRRAAGGLGRQRPTDPERFWELYEEAPVPYVTIDAKGIIQALNGRATELLEIEPHRALGFPFRTFVVQADRGELSAHLARFARDGRAVSELALRSFAGREIAVRLESRRTVSDPRACWSALF
ncbi:MAG TPA: PAS domain-containing protein, partial [Polyangia bacterium]|nr:PAS domain-containing protein [Polyangia bacterium]